MLEVALASVAAQTYLHHEVIVVTDTQHRGVWWAEQQRVGRSRGDGAVLLGDDARLPPQHHDLQLDCALTTRAAVVSGVTESLRVNME
ncbi:MAG: glycosyltransferase family A protein [Candidatus Dormibacteria bacterium]|jgi:type IV secretory pathway VirB3-like protein